MGLALVQVPVTEFQMIRGHLLTYMGAYQNMHLREACQRNNARDLRYLHAMYASARVQEIEGAISCAQAEQLGVSPDS